MRLVRPSLSHKNPRPIGVKILLHPPGVPAAHRPQSVFPTRPRCRSEVGAPRQTHQSLVGSAADRPVGVIQPIDQLGLQVGPIQAHHSERGQANVSVRVEQPVPQRGPVLSG